MMDYLLPFLKTTLNLGLFIVIIYSVYRAIEWVRKEIVKEKLAQENKTDVSRNFNTLMFVGKINSLFGWIMVAGCVVAMIVGLISGATEKTIFYLISVFGVLLIPISLLVVASGQMISCFVSIERNTKDTSVSTERNTKDIKDTNELLRQILDKMEDKPNQQEEDKENQ